ncbi:MAG TPA: VTT domain-containing protein [Candidatus Levybacteria bacterium]|nr:VTT domain-containing protein [Candidatus Levybacteria bacterium]
MLLFGVILLETSPFGIFAPGLLILVLSGYYAGIGELQIATVIGVGIVAAICGDLLGFSLGRFGFVKMGWLKKYFLHLDMVKKNIETKKNFIIYAHFPGYARALVPLLIGILRFPFKKWIWRDVIGVVGFVLLYTGIGYVIGITTKDLAFALTLTKTIQWIFVILFGLWLLVTLYTLKQARLSS